MVMTYIHAKGQGQRSLVSKYLLEAERWMDGRTDGRRTDERTDGPRITFRALTRSVTTVTILYITIAARTNHKNNSRHPVNLIH